MMYRPTLHPEVSQGDLFDDVPIAYVAFPVDAASPQTTVQRVRAMLLTHDCDYDKRGTDFVIVAQVLPLSVVDSGSQGHVRTRRTRNTFYLEPMPADGAEAFVDFRRIDRVHKQIVASLAGEGKRMASLTEEARLALQRQIAQFFGYGRTRGA